MVGRVKVGMWVCFWMMREMAGRSVAMRWAIWEGRMQMKAGWNSLAEVSMSWMSLSSRPRMASYSVRAEMKRRESVSYQRGSSWVV